ncbi:MAG: tetratricopeptide repeat protein [Brumimicrobium sp.]
MKNCFYILMTCFFGLSLQAQSWEDSLQKGKQFYKEGKYPQAYKTLLEAQRIAPKDVDLSKDIGNAAYRSGDYKTAKSAFESAVASEETNQKRAQKWHNVGNSQMKEKDYAGAIESYKNALRQDPTNNKTRYNLAEAKRRLKQQEEDKKNQNDENDQNQDKQDSQDQQNNQNQQNDENKDSNKGDDQQQEKNNKQNNQGDNANGEEQPKSAGKLSDKKTERLLEEFLKKEMETKRKVRGVNSKENKGEAKSGKKW